VVDAEHAGTARFDAAEQHLLAAARAAATPSPDAPAPVGVSGPVEQ
jgi:hypothetical protein